MSTEVELQTKEYNAFYRPFWGEPRYLNDGDAVWLPLSRDEATGKLRVLRCTAAVVAGNHARIVCHARGIDQWARLSALLVPPDDPRHWNQAP